jgi:KDO2-lipid IV(A) lauroyltransferase
LRKPAVQIFLEFLSRFSVANQYRLGSFLASLVNLIPNQLARQTRDNIELCLPNLDERARAILGRQSIRQTCYSFTELASIWCRPASQTLSAISSENVCTEFAESNKARIVLAPHLGSWEALALWLGQECQSMFLYKERKNAALDRFIIEARGRTGGAPVSTQKQGLRKLLSGLKKGQTAMILPDQKPPGNKVRVAATFFSHRAMTTTLVHNLCEKIDCDVFIATALRSSPPGKFDLHILPLESARLADRQSVSVQYMNDQIEALVELQSAQYQWDYRRFEKAVYPRVKR